jgi:hypothetical protein
MRTLKVRIPCNKANCLLIFVRPAHPATRLRRPANGERLPTRCERPGREHFTVPRCLPIRLSDGFQCSECRQTRQVLSTVFLKKHHDGAPRLSADALSNCRSRQIRRGSALQPAWCVPYSTGRRRNDRASGEIGSGLILLTSELILIDSELIPILTHGLCKAHLYCAEHER